MAELKCKDGTIIKISDETEAELRKAFEEEPKWIAAVQGYDGKFDSRVLIHLAELTSWSKERLLQALNQDEKWIAFNKNGGFCYADEDNGLKYYCGDTKIIF